jgi:hypothetical protein
MKERLQFSVRIINPSGLNFKVFLAGTLGSQKIVQNLLNQLGSMKA